MNKIITYKDREKTYQILLSGIKIEKPPVPIVQIAQKEGFTIFKGDISDLEIAAIGSVEYTSRKIKKQIILDGRKTINEQRFLTAYLLLKWKKIEVQEEFLETIYQIDLYDSQLFEEAIELLMPNRLFKKETIENDELLAKKYQVSEKIVKMKKKNGGS